MANQVTTTFRIDAQGAINSLNQYNTQLQRSIQLQRQLGASVRPAGGGGGGGTGGGGGIGGALGGLGGIAGSLFGGISVAAAAAFAKTAVDAAADSARANRSLAASALEAGKSYSELSKASADFARSAGISNAQAARSTAQLQRLVSLAGEGDQLEKYQKGFLDLAAARGVQFEELDTLFQGIIAGTDDALNRFGKADPSKLAATYAASIGKSVDALTEQEKVLSRLSAFTEDFSIFSGANEARLQSFDGQMDQFNAKLADTVSLFGNWIIESDVVQDYLEGIAALMKELGGSMPTNETVTKLIEEGKTDAEIIKALGGGKGPTTYQRIRDIGGDALQFLFGFGGGYDAEAQAGLNDIELQQKVAAVRSLAEPRAKMAQERAKQIEAKKEEDRIKAEFKARTNELTRLYTFERAQAEGNLSIIEAERRSMLDGTMAAEMRYNQEVSAARISALRMESEMQNELLSRQISLAEMSGQSEEVTRLNADKQLFNLKQNVAIRLEEINAQQKQADLEKKRAEAIKQITLDLRGQAVGFAGEQNPYVKIFNDARTAAEELLDKTKEFGKEFRNSIRAGISERANIALLSQDINNLRGATSLRREARELLFGIDPTQFSPEEAEEYRRRTIQEDIQAIDDAYRRSNRGASAERLRDQAIIQATQGVSFRELYQGDRAEAISAREREATRLEQDRDKAREVFDRILSEFGSGGIPVKLVAGQSTITIVDESNGRAEVATRPTPASTRARY